MLRLKMFLVLCGFIAAFLFPAGGAQAAPSLSNAYQDKVIFHSASHIAKWNKSTLKGLDPHVLAAFIGLMLVIIPGTFVYRGRKNQSKAQEAESKINATSLDIKRQMILNKTKQLEEQFAQGKINQAEYTNTLASYRTLLKKVEEERR